MSARLAVSPNGTHTGLPAFTRAAITWTVDISPIPDVSFTPSKNRKLAARVGLEPTTLGFKGPRTALCYLAINTGARSIARLTPVMFNKEQTPLLVNLSIRSHKFSWLPGFPRQSRLLGGLQPAIVGQTPLRVKCYKTKKPDPLPGRA